jgi:bacteriocin-like protein
MEEKKEKRVLRIELDDDVKKVSITGKNGEEKVVMRQELNEDDLDQVTGGQPISSVYL